MTKEKTITLKQEEAQQTIALLQRVPTNNYQEATTLVLIVQKLLDQLKEPEEKK